MPTKSEMTPRVETGKTRIDSDQNLADVANTWFGGDPVTLGFEVSEEREFQQSQLRRRVRRGLFEESTTANSIGHRS